MKSVIHLFVVLLSVLFCAGNAHAHAFLGKCTRDGVEYDLTFVWGSYDSGSAYVSGWSEEIPADVVIPKSFDYDGYNIRVHTIWDEAFKGCTKINSISCPYITAIKHGAFEDCVNLKSIDMSGVKTVGYDAFRNSGLTSLNIPAEASVSISGLVSCRSLTEINVEEGNEDYSSLDGVLYNVDKSSLYVYPPAKAIPDGKLVLPESVRYIESEVFRDFVSITSVVFPPNLEGLGYHAFDGCTGLTEVVLPESVTRLGQFAFTSCSSLRKVHLGSKIKAIDYATFQDCVSLEEVNIPEGVTEIGSSAFSNCKLVKEFQIANVTEIGFAAFDGCASLKSIEVNDAVEEIDVSTFEGCAELEEVVIGAGVKKIGNKAFWDCPGLKKVYVRMQNVPEAGEKVFSYAAYDNATLYLPEGCSAGFKYEDPWRNFGKVEYIQYSGIDGVEADAFAGVCDVYTTAGVLVRGGVTASEWNAGLAPGIYIVRQADGRAHKALVK